MKNGVLRFLPSVIFIITGVMAIVQERDYWEAASWFSFAVAVLIFAVKPSDEPGYKTFRNIAYLFMVIGIILLILRVTGVLPEPVRPLP